MNRIEIAGQDQIDESSQDQIDESSRTIKPEKPDPESASVNTLAEGRFEVYAYMPGGRCEVFEKDRRKVELVGGDIAGGRIVVTNLWTRVRIILPADALVKIYY